jgi:hypothetical protein
MAELAVLDGREYALIITVGLDGVVDVRSCQVDRPQAARLLRQLADAFEAKVTNG